MKVTIQVSGPNPAENAAFLAALVVAGSVASLIPSTASCEQGNTPGSEVDGDGSEWIAVTCPLPPCLKLDVPLAAKGDDAYDGNPDPALVTGKVG